VNASAWAFTLTARFCRRSSMEEQSTPPGTTLPQQRPRVSRVALLPVSEAMAIIFIGGMNVWSWRYGSREMAQLRDTPAA
jgi:hypothetical protein